MSVNQIDNIGKPRIKVDTIDGLRNILDITLMLTQQGGYRREIVEESTLSTLVTLNITSPQFTRLKHKTGFWNRYTFSWENFPLPLAQAKYIISILNEDRPATQKIWLWPKYTVSEPGISERVNYVGGGIAFNNSDNPQDFGNFGVKLVFESYQTRTNIEYFDPSATRYYITGDDGYTEILLAT